MSVYAWLHRRGIARVINSHSQSWTDRGGAYIQGRGPRWLAERLAMYTLRRSAYIRLDWQTIRVVQAQNPGRWCWRFHIAFRRL